MKKSRITNEARKAIYRRDGYQCAVCGDNRRLQIHHITKRSQGGGDEQMNLVTLCSVCHALAHGIDLAGVDLTPEDVSQCIVEYMADYYAEQGLRWPDGEELTAVYGTPVPDIALSYYLGERQTRHEDECARLFGDYGEKIGSDTGNLLQGGDAG